MVFSTFSVFFCGNILGWFGDATLTIGVCQVCLAGLFMICAYQRGYYASFRGNMNLIFSFYFGVLGGVTNILMGAGVEMNGLVLAVPNIIAGVVLFDTYAVIANVNACGGVNLPYGKPLFK